MLFFKIGNNYMNDYERYRVLLAIVQIIATLFSPFVIIYVNNKLNKE